MSKVKLIPGARSKGSRRWAVGHGRAGGQLSDLNLTPEEVHIGLVAYLMQHGEILQRINMYDPNKDLFHITVMAENGRNFDRTIEGEYIAGVVTVARGMAHAGIMDGHKRPLLNLRDTHAKQP